MSDKKNPGKVILTSTPSAPSVDWDRIAAEINADRHEHADLFRAKYESSFIPPEVQREMFSKVGAAMSDTADAFKGLSGAMTSDAATTSTISAKDLMDSMRKMNAELAASKPPRRTVSSEDLAALIDSTAPMPKPAEPELRGSARIAAAMRAQRQEKERAILERLKAAQPDDDAPRQEPKPLPEVNRGPEWGSW